MYCLLPLGLAPANSTPTFVNLTFNLDGNFPRSFVHGGDQSSSGFQPNVNVVTYDGLDEVPHTLDMSAGVDSVFLLDYLIYTQTDGVVSQTITAPGAELTSNGTPSTTSNGYVSIPSYYRQNRYYLLIFVPLLPPLYSHFSPLDGTPCSTATSLTKPFLFSVILERQNTM